MSRPIIAPEMLEGEYLFRRYGACVTDYERAANEDTRLELLDGVLIMHSPANIVHEDSFAFLLTLIRGYAAAKRVGRCFGSRTPVILDDERRFEPDLVFLRTEHLHRLGDVAIRGPADLVIEILSPATRDYDLGDKRTAYADGGIPEYWMIDPAARQLLVDRPAGKRFIEIAAGRYDCEVVPSFWIEVSWLWQVPLPDPNVCLAKVLTG